MAQGGTSSPSGAASNTPFAPQQQPNSSGGFGGGFSGGFGGGQTVGTMGGFGGDLGTAGMGGQQNSKSIFMRPENPIPYTGPTDPSQFLNKINAGLGDWLAQQQQQPNAGSQFNAAQNPGANRSNVPDWVQAPEPGTMTGQAFTELTNPATGEKFMAPSTGYSVRQQPPPAPNQVAQPVPLQNPFQPEEPSYMKDPEYQGYETQARDLSRQMDEYMKKAPMYQQLQELQGKMSPFQQREMQQREMQRMQQNPMGGAQYGPYEQQRDQQAYQQQQLQRQQLMQQFNPYQQRQQPFNPYARQMPQQMPFNKGMPYRQPAYDPNNMLAGEKNYYNRMAQQRQSRQNPYQQPYSGGLQGLMEMLGRRGMPQAQPRMSMDMSEPVYAFKNGGKV